MAKNSKGGLGRGLNSLIGGYEAPSGGKPSYSREKVSMREKDSRKPDGTKTEESSRTVEREVIREENLTREDRAVIDREKRERLGSRPTAVVESGKEEFIEEDGVTIKGVVERRVVVERTQADEAPVVDDDSADHRDGNRGKSSTSPSSRDASNSALSQEGVDLRSAFGEGVLKEGGIPTSATDEVDITRIFPNPHQPRTQFNAEELEELSTSIAKDGLLQPILVREVGDKYEIIAGERRWQACRLAGVKKVPIRVKNVDDAKVLELALVENLQRSDLNPIEEAYGYKRMMERDNKTQSEVATAVSKGRSTIANALRLLDLPEIAQQLLYEEVITAGHARAILSIPSDEGRMRLTEKLSKEKMSVREAESLARLIAGKEAAAKRPPKPPAPPLYKKAAKTLGNAFHTKVRIRSANGKNKIEIEFKDEADLQRIFDMINSPE